ncbi:MAG: pentapeptide repeat-containing protein [Bacteroidetes bacterium]|nr:pentapeptide repeat-containing protein [Bacteroidota bacterium]
MLSSRRLSSHVLSGLLTASVVIALAAPTWAQGGFSEACPNGLRTVEDPMSEAPDLTCTDLAGADLVLADLAGADLRGTNLSGANLNGAYLGAANLAERFR